MCTNGSCLTCACWLDLEWTERGKWRGVCSWDLENALGKTNDTMDTALWVGENMANRPYDRSCEHYEGF